MVKSILPSLPDDFPSPIIIAQHVPNLFFTESLAQHLSRQCELTVKVAEGNEIIEAHKIYIAPGGSHMTLRLLPSREVAPHIKNAKSDILTPSVDLVMESAAKIFYGNAVGIILTGMGYDGREGMKTIKEAGGSTIVQDESSLIFGMPKAVIDEGYADKILPISAMASAMAEFVL